MTLLNVARDGARAGIAGAGSFAIGPLGGAATGPLIVGGRPDAFRIGAGGPGEGLAARVEYTEYLGDEAFVYCRLPDGTLVSVRVAPDIDHAPDTDVTLLPQQGALHFFDALNGQRIDPETEPTN
jgi:multiple sugar transport system ATP-binding protein